MSQLHDLVVRRAFLEKLISAQSDKLIEKELANLSLTKEIGDDTAFLDHINHLEHLLNETRFKINRLLGNLPHTERVKK